MAGGNLLLRHTWFKECEASNQNENKLHITDPAFYGRGRFFAVWPKPGRCQISQRAAIRNFLTLSGPCHVIAKDDEHRLKRTSYAGAWISLGTPETTTVNECSIAGDRKRLFVFYENYHPEDMGNNVGFTREWTGDNWSDPGGQVIDCNAPKIAVKDSVVVKGWEQSDGHYGFSVDKNGNSWGVVGNSLYKEYNVHVAIAEKDKSYIEYTPGFGQTGVCVHCPPSDYGCIMNGHSSNIGTVVNPQFTADDSGWSHSMARTVGYMRTEADQDAAVGLIMTNRSATFIVQAILNLSK